MEGQVTPDPFLLDPDPEPVPSVRMTRVPGKVTDPPPKTGRGGRVFLRDLDPDTHLPLETNHN